MHELEGKHRDPQQASSRVKSRIVEQIAKELKAGGRKTKSGVTYAKGSYLKSHYSKGEQPIYSKGSFIKSP